MIFKDNYKPNITSSLFSSQKQFNDLVKAALEESERGGYRVGTPGFIRMVAGNTKLNNEEFGELKKAINIQITNIKKDDQVVPEKEKTANEKLADKIRSEQDVESTRIGIHPEDYNKL